MKIMFAFLCGLLTTIFLDVALLGILYQSGTLIEKLKGTDEWYVHVNNWLWVLLSMVFFLCLLSNQKENHSRNKTVCGHMFIWTFNMILWIIILLIDYGVFSGLENIVNFPKIYQHGTLPYFLALSIVLNFFLLLQSFNKNKMTTKECNAKLY